MLEFREVLIRWRDETNSQGWESRTVAVGGDWSLNDNDDDVFFYFADDAEYEECLKNGEADFVMTEEVDDE